MNSESSRAPTYGSNSGASTPKPRDCGKAPLLQVKGAMKHLADDTLNQIRPARYQFRFKNELSPLKVMNHYCSD